MDKDLGPLGGDGSMPPANTSEVLEADVTYSLPCDWQRNQADDDAPRVCFHPASFVLKFRDVAGCGLPLPDPRITLVCREHLTLYIEGARHFTCLGCGANMAMVGHAHVLTGPPELLAKAPR